MEKNQGGFTVSEPCCERAFPLKGKEILLQSVSLLTPVRNRRIHAPLTHPLPFTFLCCSSSALPLNLLVMMQLIESGERRGRKTVSGKKSDKKERNTSSPQSLREFSNCGKCVLVVSSSFSREHSFQEAQGLCTHSFLVTSHL